MRLAKKITLIVVLICVTFTSTACSLNDVVINFPTALSGVSSRNQEVLNTCLAMGIISDKQHEEYSSALTAQLNLLIDDSNDANVSDGEVFKKSITWVNRNADYTGGQIQTARSLAVASPVQPIDIFARSNINDMNDIFNLKIWVLKYSATNDDKALDDLKAIVDKCKENDGRDPTLEGKLRGYFKDSGKKLFSNTIPVTKATTGNLSSGFNGLGRDLVLRSTYTHYKGEPEPGTVDSIAARLVEFNPEFVSELNNLGSYTEGKYLKYSNNLYLLEYPVEYIKEIEKEGDGFKVNTEKADYSMNIWSGQLITTDGVVIKASPSTVTGASASDTADEATGGINSFFLSGKTSYANVGAESEEVINCHKVVLRDYAELLHMPGIVDGENLVNLGRRIRVIESSGDSDKDIAKYVDKNGRELVNTDGSSIRLIKASDLMSVWSGNTGHEEEKLKLPFGSNEVSEEGEAEEEGTGGVTDQKRLVNTAYKDSIECTTRFPGPMVGSVDNSRVMGDNEREIFYGMALDVDMYESGLMATWVILDKEDDRGGLDWWNSWLTENTYSYNVDRTKVENFLTGIYAYDLGDNNTIILDLGTVGKIQHGYDLQGKEDYVNKIRTGSVILGMILIAYAVLVCCAWIFDTSVVGGPRTLELMTFGRWIPITSENDLPYSNIEEKHFMTLGDIAMRAMVIATIGVLLFFIDVVQITDYLVSTIGTIADKLTSVILN